MNTIDYKDLWCHQYEANIDAGMDEDQAAEQADEYVTDYMLERADYLNELRKEERMNDE